MLCNSMLYFLLTKFGISKVEVFSYINPLVILQSVTLLKVFAKIDLKYNKIINWLSQSAFAVYLIHINSNFINPVYCKFVNTIYSLTTGLNCLLLILLFCTLVFILSVILDQARKGLWKRISCFMLTTDRFIKPFENLNT